MTLLQKRDAILDSLRAQLLAKVSALVLKNQTVVNCAGDQRLDAILLDIANNVTQAIADDEPTLYYSTES